MWFNTISSSEIASSCLGNDSSQICEECTSQTCRHKSALEIWVCSAGCLSMPKSALINFLATPHLEAFVWVPSRKQGCVKAFISGATYASYCQHFACCAAARNNSRAGLSVLLRCARLPDIASLLYGLTYFPPPTFPEHKAGHYIRQVFVQ